MKINIETSKFLAMTDINHKDVLEIISEGKWQESQRFKKEDGTPQNEFRINLKIPNGEIRNTTLNWTNVKLLVQGFGDDSLDWVNKKVRAWKTKSEKAKSGFSYLYVPTDWTRDDTGEWIIPENENQKNENEDEDDGYVDIDDIPFENDEN